MKSMIEMTLKVLKMKFPWNFWIYILIAVNLGGGIYFFESFEAKLVLISFISAAILMSYLYSKYGFTRILGLGHFLWLPMMGILYERVFNNTQNELGKWILIVVVINTLSLIIDFIDVLKYLAGDTSPTD